jgi:prevent-host-death family protein
MNIAVSEAEGQLAELVQRAEGGEEVVLTLHGTPAVRLVPIVKAQDPAHRAAVIDRAIAAAAEARAMGGPSAARSQDFLYDDETGLPA